MRRGGNAQKPWSEKEDQELMKLLAQGRSIVSIAVKFKRTSAAVRARSSKLRGGRASSAEK